MKTGLHFLFIFLSITCLFFGIFSLLIPKPEGAPKCNENIYDKNCDYILEKKFDSSIKSLKGKKVYLGDFKYSFTSGGPWCNPTWYAIRYVRYSDGAYGELSDWTTQPIFSGSNNLPCYPINGEENCSKTSIPFGQASCDKNEIKIVTNFPLDYDLLKEEYAINVHRQIGAIGQIEPNPNDEGKIIGMMLPLNSSSYGFTSFYVDFENPTPTAQWCPGCNQN